MEDLYLIYSWKTAALFGVVVLILRPLGVFASTVGSNLKLNEKLFISWVGPRGIVAAGIASLFGSKLANEGVPGAEYITPLVFMIVLGTVLLNATTARLFAKVVGVFLKQSEGIMIVGASKFSRLLAIYLKNHGRSVVLIDTNKNNIQIAMEEGLDAKVADVYSDSLSDDIEYNNVGYLLALTGNSQINDYAIERFGKLYGENGAFRIVHSSEVSNPNENPDSGLFSATDDYVNLMEVARHHGEIHEIALTSAEHFKGLIEITKIDPNIVPLFIRYSEKIDLVPSMSLDINIEIGENEEVYLVYMGKHIVEQASGEVTMEEAN
jgi:hypothetical protein